MQKPSLIARSLSFAPDGTPYALVRRSKELHIVRICGDRTEWIRAVGKAWWLRIVGDHAVVADDGGVGPLISYELSGSGRGRGVSIDGETRFQSWLCVTSTCGGSYAVGGGSGGRIFRLEGAGGIDLDATPAARTATEREARFFVVTANALYVRQLGDGAPPKWQLLVAADLQRCKQVTYDARTDRVVAVSGASQVQLFDATGAVTQRASAGGGAWSVASVGGRLFVYDDRHGVVELAADGRTVSFEIDGQIARNQCLFASDDTLYFACARGIHCLRGDRWSLIELGDPMRVPARPAKPVAPTPVATSATSESLWARVVAGAADLDTLRVLADALQTEGDPRGELIALQCTPSPTPAQTRRIAALLAAHQHAWLGPLADAASRGSVVFRHGLLRAIGLKKAAAARARGLRGCAQWATVERLDITMWDDAAALQLLGDPTLRALRVVDGLLSISSLTGLGVLPWHTLSLRFINDPRQVDSLCQVANLPALRHLSFEAHWIDQGLLEPVWRCSLVQQLHGLQVQCRRMRAVIPLWSEPLAHLQQLTILPGGGVEEPGWVLRLRRDAAGTSAEVWGHHARDGNYQKLAALLVAVPPLVRLEIAVSSPNPPERDLIERAAAPICGEVIWTHR